MLLTIYALSKSFGSQLLFENITFSITSGDRIGLVGPNGAGKSTLLKIMVGCESPDGGEIVKKQGLKIGYASQMPEFSPRSLEEVLLEETLEEDQIEALTKARILLSKAGFTDFTQNATHLSGGLKKRLDILRALMKSPDLLFLDEPTNHLDLEGIQWLEKFLLKEKITFLAVSHDRYFIENVANKVIELNKCYPKGIFISEGSYSTFITRKTSFLEEQAELERGLKLTVKEEIEWLRKSPKARTTKSQARVQKAHKLIDELSFVKERNRQLKVSEIGFSASMRETRKLLIAHNLTKSLDEKLLFKGINLILSPGSRLGIVGRNGTGKTTLLKTLGGWINPDMGTLKYAENLKLVYFDQHREHLPSHISLKEALSGSADHVNYRGNTIHVHGWAKKFLFPIDKLSMPIGALSGGEKARILIARLMLKEADILFLDEPTNDLDVPTLEIIEESLQEFPGACVIISHDRCLMDRVCTQILGLGEGLEQQLFADYKQWENALVKPVTSSEETHFFEEPKKNTIKKSEKPKRLSYKEQRELEEIEKNILAKEEEITSLLKQVENISMQSDSQKSFNSYNLLAEAQKQLEALYERFQFLLNIKN